MDIGYIVERADRFPDAIERARDDPFALIDPDYRIVLARPEMARRARDAGIPLAVWTVGSEEDAERLLETGVTRFTTNDVERLLAWKDRRQIGVERERLD